MQRRMKKIFSLLLASAMVLALVSCGKQATETPAEESTQTAQEPAQTSEEPAAEHTIDTPAAEDSYLPVTVSYIYGYRTADDGTTIASSKCPTIELKELAIRDDGTTGWRLADGYDALNAAIEKWDKETETVNNDSLDANEEFAKAAMENGAWYDGQVFADETSATVKRADSTVLSVSLKTYGDEGGAHPSTMYSGVTFDSQTGTILKVSDLVTDTDKLAEETISRIHKEYPDINDGLSEEALTSGVKRFLSDGTGEGECFSLSAEGMDIAFSADFLTSHAYGPVFVSLPFADYPDLFNEKYAAAETEYFVPVEEGATITTPLGQRISWYLETAVTQEGIDDPANYKLHITVDGHETAFPAELSYSVKTYGLFKNNKYYLYCDGAGDDGYHSLLVYEISGTGAACLSGDTPLSLGFYDYTPVDSDHFILQGRSQVLGTEQVGRYYSVGTDGLPVKEDKPWTYIVTDENGDLSNRTLTVRQEVTMEEVRDADDYDFAKKRDTVTLEPDDKLTLRTTDNSNTAILETEDGKYLRVTLAGEDGDMVGGCQFIDGKDASEIFDVMILAG